MVIVGGIPHLETKGPGPHEVEASGFRARGWMVVDFLGLQGVWAGSLGLGALDLKPQAQAPINPKRLNPKLKAPKPGTLNSKPSALQVRDP